MTAKSFVPWFLGVLFAIALLTVIADEFLPYPSGYTRVGVFGTRLNDQVVIDEVDPHQVWVKITNSAITQTQIFQVPPRGICIPLTTYKVTDPKTGEIVHQPLTFEVCKFKRRSGLWLTTNN